MDAARSKRKRWASHRNLVPASEAELRAATMPDLLPHAGATAWPGPPSQPGAAARLDEFRRALGGRSVRIGDLWEPAEWERFQRWMQRARRGVYQPPARFPQSSLVPLARGYVWDTRDPQDCRPMEPSDIDTPFPGRRQIDRRAFRRLARELGSLDEDIIGQVGGGGVESRSRCELTSELHAHAPGVAEHPGAAAKAVDEELGEEWALGPFYLPPTVPIRALPRDVIMQQRSRVVDDQGTIEDYEKPRITLNPSAGPDSVNAGIPPEERSVALTTARDLGYGLALIDVPARDAGVGVAGYGVDMTSAYSFLQVQRLDWWQFAYIWFDAAGAAHFRLLIRVGFGGAMSPRRFQSVSVIITTLARRWQREFDERHPPPEAVLRWQRARRRLQRAGSLPPGGDQLAAAIAGVYIDDLAGGCCDDDVPMPDTWQGMSTAGVNLGAPAAFAVGGQPLRRDSRPAVHCVIAIAAIRALGLEETPGKTEGGDVFVNLGLRLRLRDGFLDCPPSKRRILLRDLRAWHASVERAEPFERKVAERQVGRMGNLTHTSVLVMLPVNHFFSPSQYTCTVVPAGYESTGSGGSCTGLEAVGVDSDASGRTGGAVSTSSSSCTTSGLCAAPCSMRDSSCSYAVSGTSGLSGSLSSPLPSPSPPSSLSAHSSHETSTLSVPPPAVVPVPGPPDGAVEIVANSSKTSDAGAANWIKSLPSMNARASSPDKVVVYSSEPSEFHSPAAFLPTSVLLCGHGWSGSSRSGQ